MRKLYSVWVDGVEVNNYYMKHEQAEWLKEEYEEDGYEAFIEHMKDEEDEETEQNYQRWRLFTLYLLDPDSEARLV